jgi:hypothetical protein
MFISVPTFTGVATSGMNCSRTTDIASGEGDKRSADERRWVVGTIRERQR